MCVWGDDKQTSVTNRHAHSTTLLGSTPGPERKRHVGASETLAIHSSESMSCQSYNGYRSLNSTSTGFTRTRSAGTLEHFSQHISTNLAQAGSLILTVHSKTVYIYSSMQKVGRLHGRRSLKQAQARDFTMLAEAVCDILRWCGMRSPSTDKKRGKDKEWVTRDVDVMKTGRVVCKRCAGGSGFIAAFGQALKSHIKVIAYLVPCTAHNSICESSFEVPIFAKIEPDVECMQLDLQAVWLRPSDDGDLHHMYAWPLINYNCRTIIIAAMFPFGHYPEPLPQFDSDALAEFFGLLEYHESSVAPELSIRWKEVLSKPFVSVKDQTVVTEEMLTMTGKWLSSFLSDIKRLAKLGILSPAPLGFSLLDQAPRVMKGEWALALMQRLLLPIQVVCQLQSVFRDNGFVWFLDREITKSLIYHVVFWASILAFIPTTMGRPTPTPSMLAFVGASCYSAILQWLAELLKAMSAAILLLVQHDDPGYPVFVARMTALCNILTAPHTSRSNHLKRQVVIFELPNKGLCPWNCSGIVHKPLVSHSHCYQGHRPLVHRYRIATAKPSSSRLPLHHSFHTVWMGRPLDLITVLQVNLNVVVMEKQLQQGELTSISFLLRGGRCYMEERMYRAQMEVTLFSKAIANLCEELDTKYYPPTAPLPRKPVYIEACQAPSPVNFDCIWPSTTVHAKCQKWLSTSSEF
ncbi:hypothetical protein DFH29DRAFT_881092 [Suillus ampliporus]|nr:hypothetical protein DFH29DRAFT_881092 [Suillus ampliporus]